MGDKELYTIAYVYLVFAILPTIFSDNVLNILAIC